MTEKPNKRPLDTLPLSQQAGIICNDPRFQEFAAIRIGLPGQILTSEAAAEYMRDVCQITSRRDLAKDTASQTRFLTLRTEFDAWLGKIATPR